MLFNIFFLDLWKDYGCKTPLNGDILKKHLRASWAFLNANWNLLPYFGAGKVIAYSSICEQNKTCHTCLAWLGSTRNPHWNTGLLMLEKGWKRWISSLLFSFAKEVPKAQLPVLRTRSRKQAFQITLWLFSRSRGSSCSIITIKIR